MIGFVFVMASPRFVTPEEAVPLVAQARQGAQTVGLFAGLSPDQITKIVETVGLDMVQLHGNESAEIVAQVRTKTGKMVMVARGISTSRDLPTEAAHPADLFLFDAKPPKGEEAQGGHGTAFDWGVLNSYRGTTPWLLAGGLTEDNVAEAIHACSPLPGFVGIDVSSGVERQKGIKDPARIAAFVKAARTAMAQNSTV